MSWQALNVPIPSIDELTQNAARLLQQSLAEAAQAADPQALTPVDLALARSNTKALSFVQGLSLHGCYRYLRDFIARQAVPTRAVGEFLDEWLATYGLVRKASSAAFGAATGTGVPGTLLPAGTLLQTDDGRQYAVLADVAIAPNGTLAVALQALLPGVAGNVPPGTALQAVSASVGVDSAFVADATSGLSGGADTETDEQAVFRLQQRLANEPMGGCPADYARWALQVPGITRAWGVRNPAGPTTAGVIVMADGNADARGVPTEAQRQQVYDYISDPRRGPPDELFVIRPTVVVNDWTIALSPDSLNLRTAVLAALQDLYQREAVPGGTIPLSHVTEAISTTVGEFNHRIVSPALASGALLQPGGYDRILVLGTVIFAGGV